MKKLILLILIILFVTGCNSKKNISGSLNQEISPAASPQVTDIFEDNTTNIVLDKIEQSKYGYIQLICKYEDGFRFKDAWENYDMSIRIYEDVIRMSYSDTGTDYYYGQYKIISDNIVAYYGEILDYNNLEPCKSGEACYEYPEIDDETIDGHFKILDDKAYFIPSETKVSESDSFQNNQYCRILY